MTTKQNSTTPGPPTNGNGQWHETISFFKTLPEKGQPHKCTAKLSVGEFLQKIKDGEWASIVQPIRAEPDKAKRSILKRPLPAITPSGVFSIRRESDLISHSGFIQIDIDDYTNVDALRKDPYIYSLFLSVSGTGYCAIIRIDPEKHKESFKWIQSYFFKKHGIAIDSAPQNVASLRFVSFDPDLYLNEKAKKAGALSSKPKSKKSIPIVLSDDQLGELVSEISASGKDIAPDYDTYLKVAFAFSTLGESGRSYFHAVCQNSPKYDSRQADRQFEICLKRQGDGGGVTMGTFYWMAEQSGFKVEKTSKKLVASVAMGKKSGRSKEALVSQLEQLNGIDNTTAGRIVDEVFSRSDISINAATGDIENLIESLIVWTNQNHNIKKNQITGMIEENGGEVNRERMNTIYLRARMFFNSKDVTKDLVESVIFSENTPVFNPITEYIEKNISRNSTGNIDALCASIDSTTTQKDLFVKKWLIGIIAAYDGNPVRYVLSLVGGQNTGKTEWFRRLLPNDLKRYYAESKLDAGKDDEILMCQKLIVMDDEMGGKSKQDEKRFKELTSKSTFSLRAPYGRHNEDFKRLAILCGTSNDPEVINDPTGNTRILPVEVISIDHNAYNSINKDELFMEMYRLYRESGSDAWQFSKDELAHLEDVSGEFETTPFERQLIIRFFRIPSSSISGDWMTATDIKNYIEINTQQRIFSLKKFGIELRKMFGKPSKKKINGTPSSCYFVEKVHLEQTDESVKGESDDPNDVPF